VDPTGESWICPTAYAPESEANFEELKGNEAAMNGVDETFNAAPGTGDANDVAQALTGHNIQGEQISGGERALSIAVAAMPVITMGMVKGVGKALLRNADEAASTFNFSRRGWTVGKSGDSTANLTGHFEKHGAEFGAGSVDDYYNQANDFIDSSESLKFTGKNGDLEYFDPNSDVLGVTDANGNIRTYHQISGDKLEGFQNRAKKTETKDQINK